MFLELAKYELGNISESNPGFINRNLSFILLCEIITLLLNNFSDTIRSALDKNELNKQAEAPK